MVDPGSVAPRTLYGVCCYVRELVHRPPSMAREVRITGKDALPACPLPGRLCLGAQQGLVRT